MSSPGRRKDSAWLEVELRMNPAVASSGWRGRYILAKHEPYLSGE
jgi:hypothetical protein